MCPLFICQKCGCVENTALSDYWSNMEKPLCSECSRGKWHGCFPKKFPKKSEYTKEKHSNFITLK